MRSITFRLARTRPDRYQVWIAGQTWIGVLLITTIKQIDYEHRILNPYVISTLFNQVITDVNDQLTHSNVFPQHSLTLREIQTLSKLIAYTATLHP